MTFLSNSRVLVNMILSRFLEKFPKLKVIHVEADGAGENTSAIGLSLRPLASALDFKPASLKPVRFGSNLAARRPTQA